MIDYVQGSTPLLDLEQNLQKKQEILNTLKDNLQKTRQRMETQANKHRKDYTFNPGDWVLLRLQPYRQKTVARRVSQKLAKRYFGPFQILRRIGMVAYELDLPPPAKIHPVVHISMLRPYQGDDPARHFKPLPEIVQNTSQESSTQGGEEIIPTLTAGRGFSEDSRNSEKNIQDKEVSATGGQKEAEKSDISGNEYPQNLKPSVILNTDNSTPSQSSIRTEICVMPPTLPTLPAPRVGSNLEDKVPIEERGSDSTRPKRSSKKPSKLDDYICVLNGSAQ